MNAAKVLNSVPELLAHSLAIETEAAERYDELADQMEVHNNLEVAELFRKMAVIEGKHIDQVKAMIKDVELPHIPPWEYQWLGDESPEAPQDGEAHYLMNPHQALQLALNAEQRAASFFWRVADSEAPEDVRAMARQLAEEEDEHVELVRQWLNRLPPPEDDWDFDPDPPNLHD